VPIEFEVVSFWVRSDINIPGQGQSRLRVLSPSGKIIGESEAKIDLTNYERHRQRTRFHQGLPATEQGRYNFIIELQLEGNNDWHRVASIPLKLVFNPPDEKQTDLFRGSSPQRSSK
jgi:hypothetical protein